MVSPLNPSLVHSSHQPVDVLASKTGLAELVEVVQLGAHAALGGGQLEGPQVAGGLLEVLTNGEDLVNEILHAVDAVLTETGGDDRVVGDGDSLSVVSHVPTLVDEFPDGSEVGVAVSDVRLDQTEHVGGGSVHSDKDAVVQLSESEQSQDLPHLGADTDDTSDSDDEDNLRLGGDVQVPVLLGLSSVVDQLSLGVFVLLFVGSGSLSEGGSASLSGLLELGSLLSDSLLESLVSGDLLLLSLGNVRHDRFAWFETK